MGRKIGAQIRAICEFLEKSGPQTKRQTVPDGMTRVQLGNHYRLIARGIKYGVIIMDNDKVSAATNWRTIADRKKEKPAAKAERGEVTKSPFSLLIAEWGRTCG